MNAKERNSINCFLFTCEELKRTAFGQQFSVAGSRSYRLQSNSSSSTKIKRKFSSDEWRSFALAFRKLTLNDDPTYIFRVLNILSVMGSKSDQVRIRLIKSEMNKAARSTGLGVFKDDDGSWKRIDGKEVFQRLINEVLFHNHRQVNSLPTTGIFEFGAMIHYVVFVYKQALRVEASIKIRFGLQ